MLLIEHPIANVIYCLFSRSAYITFANKESVDKAVALSGTSFFSRIVKVCITLYLEKKVRSLMWYCGI